MMSDEERAQSLGPATQEKLRQYVARIERLEAEKAELAADIREVYSEAKSFGFQPKILRKVISLRKMEPSDRAEEEALLDAYLTAVSDV